ncbi:potassium-transporting ATPase subunit F, partial [Pseudomonas sp. FSL R10-0071]|nr:potassium-transporting ATPase subunit F [Pseudomonas sp. FSL R10-0071]
LFVYLLVALLRADQN